MKKRFIGEQQLLEDAYRLATRIYDSGFRPDFIVGLWRGGSTVGIYVQECLQYLGIETDHIAIRTSYRGRDDYLARAGDERSVRVHGMQYLFENLNADDALLIVDDVYGSGRSIAAVIERLRERCKRNLPGELRSAVPYFRPDPARASRRPDYFLVETADWLVLPYELTGISRAEMLAGKPWIVPLLDELRPGWE